jgi:hypothetical protein
VLFYYFSIHSAQRKWITLNLLNTVYLARLLLCVPFPKMLPRSLLLPLAFIVVLVHSFAHGQLPDAAVHVNEWRLHSTASQQHGFIIPLDAKLHDKLFDANGNMSQSSASETPTSIFVDFVGRWQQVGGDPVAKSIQPEIAITAWLYDKVTLQLVLQGYSFHGGVCETAAIIPDPERPIRYHCDIGTVLYSILPPPENDTIAGNHTAAAIGIQLTSPYDLEFIATPRPNATKSATPQVNHFWELTSTRYYYKSAQCTLFSRANQSLEGDSNGFPQPYIVLLEAAIVVSPPIDPPSTTPAHITINESFTSLSADKVGILIIVTSGFCLVMCVTTMYRSFKKNCWQRSRTGSESEQDSSRTVRSIGTIEVHTPLPFTSRVAQRIRRLFGYQRQYRPIETELGVIDGVYQVTTTETID